MNTSIKSGRRRLIACRLPTTVAVLGLMASLCAVVLAADTKQTNTGISALSPNTPEPVVPGGPRDSAPIILNEYNAVRNSRYLDSNDKCCTGGTCDGGDNPGALCFNDDECTGTFPTLDGTCDCAPGCKEDSYFGRIQGNGRDWFELVVIEDHLDMTGWKLEWTWDDGVATGAGTLTLTSDPLWSDVRSGTILTFTESDADHGGADTDTFFDELTDWWININTMQGAWECVGGLNDGQECELACVGGANEGRPCASDVDCPDGSCVTEDCPDGTCTDFEIPQEQYVTTTTDSGSGPGHFTVNNDDWQLTIRDAADTIVFGPAGEGIPLSDPGVSSREVFKLEEDPTADIDPVNSDYNDGTSSTFGDANSWGGGDITQDYSALRGTIVDVELVALSAPSAGDELATLPTSETGFDVGATFYVEVWAQTSDSHGLQAVFVDVGYDATLASVATITHTAAFALFTAGTDDFAGLVSGVGGAHALPCTAGYGVTNWVRAAILEMTADQAGPLAMQSLTSSSNDSMGLCGVLGDVDVHRVQHGQRDVQLGDSGDLVLNVPALPQIALVGQTVTVDLNVANLTTPINGVQALIHYNPNNLSLTSIDANEIVEGACVGGTNDGNPCDEPGDTDCPGGDCVGFGWFEVSAIFAQECVGGANDGNPCIDISECPDGTCEPNGDIAYDATILGDSTGADGRVATLTFTGVSDSTPIVSFLGDNPPAFPTLDNRLTDAVGGQPITPTTTDTQDGDLVILAGDCLIDAQAYTDGELNPVNDCEACDPAQSTSAWTLLGAGTACGEGPTECSAQDTCDGAGACQDNHASFGAPCGDQGVECLLDDVCDGAGACTDSGPELEGTPCGDAGDTECTDPDTCDGAGACQANHALAGDACGDAGDTECTDPDTCDGAGGCQENHESAGAACGDQGVECLADDTCDGAGSCTDNGFETAGTACGDASDTGCDNPDTCDGAGGCLENYEASGTPCDDGDPCLDPDQCDGAGACLAGPPTAHIYANLDVEALGFAVTRDVTFEIAGVPGEVVVSVDFNSNGEGFVDLSDLSYQDASSICATEGHTLTGSIDLTGTWGVCEATADFTVSDQLLAGDFSNPPWVLQDNLVDIVDFAILSVYWNQPVDPDLGSLADATGDGMQDVADFTAIQANFAEVGATCASAASPDSPDATDLPTAAKFRVPVDELMVPNAEFADWNGDGLIDAQDIRLFARANRLRLTPQFREKLARMDAASRVQRLERIGK